MSNLTTEAKIETNKEWQAKNAVKKIDARLAQIDLESVRPLRAVNSGAHTQYDTDRLASLDAEAETLRQERATLIGGVR